MSVFDKLIKDTYNLLDKKDFVSFDYSDNYKKFVSDKQELIFKKDAQFELGGENLNSVAYTLFTEDDNLVDKDEIIVIGKDLNKINKDTSFARIALVRTKGAYLRGEQASYFILETINLKRYNINLKGYMIRTSVLSNREQVRVNKEAIKNKMSFRDVGSMYIDEFKRNQYVEAVKMIFITEEDIDYIKLENISTTSLQIFRALNHAISDLKMDCKRCEWQTLCSQIEGMKEFHEKMIKK